jgi:hypothetical protein
MTSEKPIHTVVLDAGPIIRGEPGVSSLLQQCEEIVSTPAVIQEIRDEATRSRLQTTLLPFVTLRSPKPESVKVISDFARKTGDLLVLSRVDIHLLALSYELECERNGGHWRLRSTPGQKRTNGPPPAPKETVSTETKAKGKAESDATSAFETKSTPGDGGPVENVESSTPESISCDQLAERETTAHIAAESIALPEAKEESEPSIAVEGTQSLVSTVEGTETAEVPQNLSLEEKTSPEQAEDIVAELSQKLGETALSDNTEEGSEESDSEGWITPSNLKKKQVEDAREERSSKSEPVKMQVVRLLVPHNSSIIINLQTGHHHRRLRHAKRHPPNELKPSLTVTPPHPPYQNLHPSLPRLLQRRQRHHKTVLPPLRKTNTNPRLLHNRRQRRIQTPSQEKHAMEPPRRPLQHPETGGGGLEWKGCWWWEGRMGEWTYFCGGSEGVC